MESAVPSEFCFYLLAAAEVKPWALGVFIVLFGLGGLAFLVCSGRDKADRVDSCASELKEGALVLCALMVVTPPLLLLPEELRQEIPAEALLIAALLSLSASGRCSAGRAGIPVRCSARGAPTLPDGENAAEKTKTGAMGPDRNDVAGNAADAGLSFHRTLVANFMPGWEFPID